ncbi:hypothetical protein B0H19DRAFT_1082295 [Mycena capillaripes]|nr:hypothetical protein B0H19DRAFT_1082295 [Mycena capillaripes]
MRPSNYYWGSRAFCEEILKIVLQPEQIGKICCPADSEEPLDNHPLHRIFDAAVIPLAQLLVSFPPDHPVVNSYESFFEDRPDEDKDDDEVVVEWMRLKLRLNKPNLELYELLDFPLARLDGFTVGSLPAEEWRRRIRAVGTAMLKILALQYELEEPLNLNGDMAEDLAEEAIQSLAHLKNEYTDVMRAMSLATKPRILAHKKYWDEDTFWDWINQFCYAHAVLSPTYNLPNYRRAMERPSRRPAISIMMGEGNVDDLPEESSRKTRPREDDDAEEDALAQK